MFCTNFWRKYRITYCVQQFGNVVSGRSRVQIFASTWTLRCRCVCAVCALQRYRWCADNACAMFIWASSQCQRHLKVKHINTHRNHKYGQGEGHHQLFSCCHCFSCNKSTIEPVFIGHCIVRYLSWTVTFFVQLITTADNSFKGKHTSTLLVAYSNGHMLKQESNPVRCILSACKPQELWCPADVSTSGGGRSSSEQV